MPPKGKPKVSIDQDGDGTSDVEVDVESSPPEPNPDVEAIRVLVRRMEVVVNPPDTRITYAGARETLRGLLP